MSAKAGEAVGGQSNTTPEQAVDQTKAGVADDVSLLDDKDEGIEDEDAALLSGDEDEGDDKDKEEGKKDEPRAPEAYDFKLPETIEVNEAVQADLNLYSDFARGIDLSPEQAQAVLDEYLRRSELSAKANDSAVKEMIASWRKSIAEDEEIGGKTVKQNLGIAKQALNRFGSPEFRKMLTEGPTKWMGTHPEIVRFLYRVGKHMTEDKVIEGDKRPRQNLDHYYPSMAKK